MPAYLSRLTACLALLLAGLAFAQPTHALRNVKVGDRIPAFAATDLTGKTLSKASCEEKVLLLTFVRPNQEKSLRVLHTTQRILQDYGDGKLVILAVSSKPDAGEYFKKLAAERGLAYPIALDSDRKMYGDFGLLVSPTTVLVDGKGVLRHELAHVPPNYERRIRVHLDHLLGKISQEEHDAQLVRMKQGQSGRIDPERRRFKLARTLLDKGSFAQAIPVLTKLRSEKDSALAAALLGTAYLGLGDLVKAAECLDPLADQSPAPPELKLALARLELRRGNEAKAEQHLLKAIKASPENGLLQYELGRLYEKQDNLDKAVQYYRKALEQVYDERR